MKKTLIVLLGLVSILGLFLYFMKKKEQSAEGLAHDAETLKKKKG